MKFCKATQFGLIASLGLAQACTALEHRAADRGEAEGSEDALQESILPTGNPADEARVGQARDSITQTILPRQCIDVSSPLVTLDNPMVQLRFGAAMSREEATSHLGFKAETKAKFKLLSGSAKAEFSRDIESKSLSISQYFRANIRLKTEELDQAKMKWLVDPASPNFTALCGDQFNWRVSSGGEIYLLYRIDFASRAEKEAFSASVSGGYSAVELNASVSKTLSTLAGRASVHLEMLQLGGDVARFGQVLGAQGEAGRVVLDCKLTDKPESLKACSDFLASGLAYVASDAVRAGFVEHPAPLEYVFDDWNRIVPPGTTVPARTIPASVSDSRALLDGLYSTQVEVLNRIRVLETATFTPSSLLAVLPKMKAAATKNVGLINGGVTACYDSILDPNDAAQVKTCVDTANMDRLLASGYDNTISLERVTDVEFAERRVTQPTFPTTYSATVTWTTDRATLGGIQYRPKVDSGTPLPWKVLNPESTAGKNHQIVLTDLEPVVTYEYQLLGQDNWKLTSVSTLDTFTTGRGNYDIGIIPASTSAAACPTGKKPIVVYMDNEDDRNRNTRSGWLGGVESMSNTIVRFCRVNGTKFLPLTPSSNYAYDYAVLSLGASCPNGSSQFWKIIDSEDSDDHTGVRSDEGVGTYPNQFKPNPQLYFCMFRYGSKVMSAFPDYGVPYGVLAPSGFPKSLASGRFYMDDEDDDNGSQYWSPYPNESKPIVGDGSNTWISLAQVR